MIATPAPVGRRQPARRSLLLSLRPRFAQAILDGVKTVELRRTRVSAPPGTLLVLYASSPVMAVVGVATLTDRETDSPEAIWRTFGPRLGLSRAEFSDYLAGVENATALSVADPRPLSDPLTLAGLRTHSPFQPPQSYRYVTAADPLPITELTVASA
jgi:predicted transcriptional regulator